jgi:hypothetical protein
MFVNGKLELNKIQILMWQWLQSLYQKGGRPRVGGDHGGALHLSLRPNTIQGRLGKNRWRSIFLWSHRIIHKSSRARTKRKLSLLAFQHIKEHLVLTSYEGDVTNFIQSGLLNLNQMRSPSWWRLVTWWRAWLVRIHFGDILIRTELG